LDDLLAGLTDVGEDPGGVDVLLTHLHADHSGNASVIGGGQRIYISEVDAKWLERLPRDGKTGHGGGLVWSRERDTLTGMPEEMVDNIGKLNPALMFAPPGGVGYTYIHDGEIINAGGYSLRCILTPGHTPGHMCLWDGRIGLMFTGDHVLFDITPNIGVWPGVEDPLGDYLDSLEMIRGYPVKTPLPGHRKPGDFHARIGELQKHHETRLAEVEGIVRAGPGLTAYDISGRMRWKIRACDWSSFPDPQKIFAIGECQSHLDYLIIRGAIVRKRDGNVHRYYPCNRLAKTPM
jgi:glyoxylase-like metal-dependent hydrolase (beta-lactamase superfamily II)